MSNSFIQSQYDLWHEQMAANEQNDVLSLPWYKTVAKSLPDLNGKSIIEVGCGRGVFSNYLANKYPGAKITAIDFSESAITIAKSNFFNVPNLHFEVGDAESLVFKEDQFDFYISCETLEHVFQPQKMIREAKRILLQGGHFVITTENYFNAYLLVWLKCWLLRKPFASGCGIQPNENFFIFIMILRWIKRSGLKLEHTESNHYQWLLLPKISPSKLCTYEVDSKILKLLFKPFGRHFTYIGSKV